MAFSKDTIKHIAAAIGLSVKDFETQFKDEKEFAVEIPAAPIKTFATQEDLDTYNKNLKDPEYGRGVDDGKKNATEIFIKEIKEKENLPLTGSQLSGEALLTALKNKFGGDNKKLIDQFEADKAELLKKATDLENDYTSKFKEQQGKIVQMKLRGESLDGVSQKTKFDKTDGVDLIMKDISIQKDAAGKEFIHYKGVQQKDDNLEPLSMKQITDNVFIEKKWYEEDSGRGKGNQGGKGGSTDLYKAFVEEMDSKGIHEGSATYQDELTKRLDDKDFKASVEKSE